MLGISRQHFSNVLPSEKNKMVYIHSIPTYSKHRYTFWMYMCGYLRHNFTFGSEMEMKLKGLFSENQQGSKIDSKEKNSPSGVVLDVPYPNLGLRKL